MPAAAHRTLGVLAALASSPEPLTVSQLTTETSIPRASLVRLLAALEEEGGVVLDDAGGYRPSLLLWRIGAGTVNRLGVRDVAFPYLVDLARKVPSHVNLCLPDFPRGSVIESFLAVGGRLTSRLLDNNSFHLLANAVGRVIAAHETEGNQLALLRIPVRRATQWSRCDATDLAEELAATRARGYATIDREHMADVSGFAVPLFDANSRPVGSLGFARNGPLEESFVSEFVPLAIESAERISWELGWRRGQGFRVS